MTTQPATHPHVGLPAGIGRSVERPQTQPDVAPGASVVRQAHDVLHLDASWSLHQGRGFTWRVGGLVQRVWWEPGTGEHGQPADRAVAETALVRDITDDTIAAELTNALNGIATMGALAADPVRHTITARTAAWVQAGTEEAVGHRFAVAVGLQAGEATNLAQLLAHATGGHLANPLHPGFAARVNTESPFTMDRLAAIAGKDASRWADGSLAAARRALVDGPLARLVVADDRAFSLPVPFCGDTAYLQAITHEAHPMLGNGLKVRLTLPPSATESADAVTAAELNRLEFASIARADLQGAWVAASGQLHHVAFHPNIAHAGPGSATDILRSGLERARWIADVLG